MADPLARLWRRTSIRVAAGFALALVAALALAALVALATIRGQLSRQQDLDLLQAWQAMAQESADDGREGVREAVAERLAAAPDGSVLVQLQDAGGQVLAGAPEPVRMPAGWSDLPREGGLPFRAYRGEVGGDTLIVGTGTEGRHDVAEVVVGAFGWAAVAVAIVALAGGALVARGVQGLVGRVEGAMARVAAGDLAARIPEGGGGGDLEGLTRSINAALARLEALVEGMRQVSSDVAHDLRTPLNRLRLRLEAAAGAAEPGSAVEAELAGALEEGERLDATFAALLRIAQIEAGARRDRFAPLDLGQVARQVAEAYEGVAEEAGLRLTLAADGPAPATGDRDLLVQALANLVENAIRHAGPGATVALRAGRAGARSLLVVADNGPGIPEAERDRVLGRFVRLEKSRTTPGSGLGLALVKAVADLHGADLKLEDAGPGLRVRLTFPPG